MHFRNSSQLYRWCHFNTNLTVSNNITIVFCSPFSFHVIADYTKVCVQSQFLAFVISVHSVLSQFTGSCRLKD